MRYQLELDIDLPRGRAVELFLDPDNLAKWQPDLVSVEHISGDGPRDVGAKTRQIHKMGGRDVEVIEIITAHNYPDEFSATYESDGVWNLIENRLLEASAERTHWVLQSELRCSSFVMRLMTIFLPGMFKKQTLTFMKRFKEFAESSGA